MDRDGLLTGCGRPNLPIIKHQVTDGCLEADRLQHRLRDRNLCNKPLIPTTFALL